MVTIVVFFVSLVVLILLVGMKMFELSHGMKSPSTRLFTKWDGKTERRVDRAHEVFHTERRRATDFVKQDLPHHSRETFAMFRDVVKEKYQSFFLNTRGVRVLRTEREASPFLKNISQERERDGKGRIEDTTISDKVE